MSLTPIRLKTELPTDLEGVRRLLLLAAPKLEPRQPGITEQLRVVDLRNPVQMLAPTGEVVTIVFEPGGDTTAVKVEVRPPGTPFGPLRARWWRWWTRFKIRGVLKMARQAAFRQMVRDIPAARDPDAAIEPEVLPPEGSTQASSRSR